MSTEDKNNLDAANKLFEFLNSGKLTSSSHEDYGDVNIPKPTTSAKSPKSETSKVPVKKPPKVKSSGDTSSFIDDKYSGFKLFQLEFEELPKLLDPIFPKVGVVSLVGSSDTGKSTFLRQLALSIAFNLDSFLGYKLDANTQNVIYISTEDDPASTSVSLKKQIKGMFGDNNVPIKDLNHIKFVFDIDTSEDSNKNIFKILENDLAVVGADLVIIDAFTDIFSGDLNSSTKVREFLNWFSNFSKNNNCLVLFLHHTGKRTDKFTASKDNVLGSQAFEAKMRVLVELKHYPNDDSKRTLTITKGNYISSQIKKYSKVLKFDEEKLLFFNEGQILSSSIATLGKTYSRKEEVLPIIRKLYSEKKSVREIESTLKSKGHTIGKSTVSNYINEIKSKLPS